MKKQWELLVMMLIVLFAVTACDGLNSGQENHQSNPTEAQHVTQAVETETLQTTPAVTEKSICGTWVGVSELADIVNSAIDSSDPIMAEFLAVNSFQVHWILEFQENGTMVCRVDENALGRAFSDLYNSWIVGYTQYITYQLEGTEMTVEEYEIQSGYTVEAMADGMIEPVLEAMNADVLYQESHYELDGDQLTIDAYNGVYTIVTNGDVLEFIRYDAENTEEFQLCLENIIYKRQ